jgi:hypothetical protein
MFSAHLFLCVWMCVLFTAGPFSPSHKQHAYSSTPPSGCQRVLAVPCVCQDLPRTSLCDGTVPCVLPSVRVAAVLLPGLAGAAEQCLCLCGSMSERVGQCLCLYGSMFERVYVLVSQLCFYQVLQVQQGRACAYLAVCVCVFVCMSAAVLMPGPAGAAGYFCACMTVYLAVCVCGCVRARPYVSV